MEEVVRRRLFDHLMKYCITSQTQLGFWKVIQLLVLPFILLILFIIVLKMVRSPITICFEIKKAFDMVNFLILLRRSESLGIKEVSLKWFESYFHGRSIKVMIDNISSSLHQIPCGVPQESVLDPLLYLVYVSSKSFIF
jgi:hypothetical protein